MATPPGSTRIHAVVLALLAVFAAASRAQVTVRASDFGAVPDDLIDDTAALRAALAAAANGPAEVVLDAGVYRVSATDGGEAALMLYQLRGVTLRGEPGRTELRVTTFMLPALILRGCRDVTVSGIAIDYDPPPFTQGRVTVVSRDEGWFEFEPAPHLPSPDWPQLQPRRGFGMLMNVAARRMKRDDAGAMFLDRWEPAATSGVWRAYPRADCVNQLDHYEPGDGYVHLARDGFAALPVLDSADCTLEDVTIYSAAAPAFTLMGNAGRITLRRCAVRFRPDADRWITTDGDGVHAPNNRVGPTIEDCFFEGMADDGVNIYASPMRILAAPAPDRLTLDNAGDMRVGDRLQVFSPAAGVVRATALVTTVETGDDGAVLVTLDQSVPDVGTSDCAFNLDHCGAGYRIERTTFADHRGRSILLRATEGGLLADNTIANANATYAIIIANEPHWPEGPMPVGGLTIRGNTIDHAGVAGISVFGFALSGFSPASIGRYVIESNTIRNVRGAAIHLGRVEHAVVRGNDIRDCAMPLAADRRDVLDTDLP